jgi:hypothetical protein
VQIIRHLPEEIMTPIRFRGMLIICLTTGLRATSLPSPVTLAECTDFGLVDDPTSCALSGRDASANGSLTLSPFVSLTASSSSGPINQDFNPGAGVFVSAKYSFQVTGGNPGDVVPLLIATNLTSSGSSFGHAYGFAEIVIQTSFGTTSVVVCSDGTCGTTNTSFSGTFSWSANSGESGDTVQLEVEANSGDSPLAESANASADPFLFIDPNFGGAGNYSILLSPGVANAIGPSVPEPGTFGVMAAAALAWIGSRFRGLVPRSCDKGNRSLRSVQYYTGLHNGA